MILVLKDDAVVLRARLAALMLSNGDAPACMFCARSANLNGVCMSCWETRKLASARGRGPAHPRALDLAAVWAYIHALETTLPVGPP